MNCDQVVLTESAVNSLLKYLPSPDQVGPRNEGVEGKTNEGSNKRTRDRTKERGTEQTNEGLNNKTSDRTYKLGTVQTNERPNIQPIDPPAKRTYE